MLGWWITVADGRTAGALSKDAALASWEIGLGGLRWLDDLVTAGKAQKLRGDGYPTRYEGRAADVLPLIADITNSINASSKPKLFPPKLDQAKITVCPPDLILTIDAWDQS